MARLPPEAKIACSLASTEVASTSLVPRIFGLVDVAVTEGWSETADENVVPDGEDTEADAGTVGVVAPPPPVVAMGLAADNPAAAMLELNNMTRATLTTSATSRHLFVPLMMIPVS